jgi:hypothetical protein
MPFVIKFIVRRELITKLADDWLRANCPSFSDMVCAECLHALGGMAGEW